MASEEDAPNTEEGWGRMILRRISRAAIPFAVTFAAAIALLAIAELAGLKGAFSHHVAGGVILVGALVAGVWSAWRDGDPA